MLQEHLDYNITAKAVAQAAHRSLGILIAKDRAHGGMPVNIFKSLYATLAQQYGARKVIV